MVHRHSATAKKHKRLRAAKGLCIDCGKAQSLTKTRCLKCTIRLVASSHLGSRTRWKELARRFRGKCRYSGKRIMIGHNAEIDHTLPSSLWPHLKGDISNLQWVHSDINTMKGKLTPRQFFRLCAEILRVSLSNGNAQKDSGIKVKPSRRLLIELDKIIEIFSDTFAG